MKKMSEKIEKNEEILQANLMDTNELQKNVGETKMDVNKLRKELRSNEDTIK